MNIKKQIQASNGKLPSVFSHLSLELITQNYPTTYLTSKTFWQLIQWEFVSAPKWVLLFKEEPNTYTEQEQTEKKRERVTAGCCRQGYEQAKLFFPPKKSHEIPWRQTACGANC